MKAVRQFPQGRSPIEVFSARTLFSRIIDQLINCSRIAEVALTPLKCSVAEQYCRQLWSHSDRKVSVEFPRTQEDQIVNSLARALLISFKTGATPRPQNKKTLQGEFEHEGRGSP
jgi:hypothetical protein